jgi:hypothetical protein
MVGMIVFLAALGWFGALFVLSREAWGGIMPWAFLALLLICAFFVSFEEEWRARRLYRRTQSISQIVGKRPMLSIMAFKNPIKKGRAAPVSLPSPTSVSPRGARIKTTYIIT